MHRLIVDSNCFTWNEHGQIAMLYLTFKEIYESGVGNRQIQHSWRFDPELIEFVHQMHLYSYEELVTISNAFLIKYDVFKHKYDILFGLSITYINPCTNYTIHSRGDQLPAKNSYDVELIETVS